MRALLSLMVLCVFAVSLLSLPAFSAGTGVKVFMPSGDVGRRRTAAAALRRLLHRAERRPARGRLRGKGRRRRSGGHHLDQRHALRLRAGAGGDAAGRFQHKRRRRRGRFRHIPHHVHALSPAEERGALPERLSPTTSRRSAVSISPSISQACRRCRSRSTSRRGRR